MEGIEGLRNEVKPTDKVGGEFCALLRIYKDAKMYGTIVVWSEPRAFGFVQPDGSTERLFVHITNFPKGQAPRLGAKVEFEIGDPISLGKKPQAVHAKILEMPTDDAVAALGSPIKPADTETPSEVLP